MVVNDSDMADSGPNTEDIKLAKRLKSGEPAAVVEFYNAYFDRIYLLVFNQVSRDGDATQDIVQETFLAALKSAGKFHGRSKLSTWLYSIANRKVADFYRRQKREAKYKTEHQSRYALEADPTSDGDLLALNTLESEEAREAVQKVLLSLPLHYRQVLLLKYVEDLPVLEISRIMKRSPKSIEGLLTRARKEIQAKLARP
jgi:RNA polymerase sigma-70 factor (ECF subfamily)